MQMEVEAKDSAESSSSRGVKEVWKKLGALAIPNADKNFLRRACHDILLTRENLLERKIIKDPACPICDFMVETGFHILWQCPATLDVWGMGLVKFQKSFFVGPSFLEVVEGMFWKCTQEEMALFAGLARRIWLRRNDILHGGGFSHPKVLLQLATRALEEFKEAHGTRDVIMHNNEIGCLNRWVAPSPG